MKEKIINLLENDYCKLSKQLATENNKKQILFKKKIVKKKIGYVTVEQFILKKN